MHQISANQRQGNDIITNVISANQSCDEHAVFSAMVEMTRVMSTKFSFFGNDVISLKSRPLIFVYLYVHTQLIQKKIFKFDIKSK